MTDGSIEEPTGFLLVDKPAGASSHDVVNRVRRELGVKRVGHAGTLDPFATGLLVVLVGRATRLQRYVLGLPKTYLATARLGWRSSTGDPEGELIETGNTPRELRLPTGMLTQTPPVTSAIKVGGERLYRKARRGEEVDRPAREVEIYEAELLEHDGERASYRIRCSAGTYIRTLIEELGDAYCERLRRTAIGELELIGGEEERLEPVERLVRHLPERALDATEARQATHGIPTEPGSAAGTEGPLRLTHEGRLIAVARLTDGLLRAEVVLA